MIEDTWSQHNVPDAVEALDADSVLLNGGVAHGDPPAEDLGDVPHPHVPHVPC